MQEYPLCITFSDRASQVLQECWPEAESGRGLGGEVCEWKKNTHIYEPTKDFYIYIAIDAIHCNVAQLTFTDSLQCDAINF